MDPEKRLIMIEKARMINKSNIINNGKTNHGLT
jgi:hypothetical protein